MKTPVIVLSGTNNEYHICATVGEVLTALQEECGKFVSANGWKSDVGIDFPSLVDAADHLFGSCLSRRDFGDICVVVKAYGDIPEDGEIEESIWE